MTTRWLLVAAFVALGIHAPAGAQCCGDCNGDGVVTIAELVTAVNHALNGCSESNPTPTPVDNQQLTVGGMYLQGIDNTSTDVIRENFADIDLCQSICSVGAGNFIGQVVFEEFGAAAFSALFSFHGSGTATIKEYSVPQGAGQPAHVTQVSWTIPGGTCSNNFFGGCASGSDCPGGTCVFHTAELPILLYSLVDKELLVTPPEMCPMLDTSTMPFTVIPSNLTPLQGDLAVTFDGYDPIDGNFSFPLHFAATLHDANHCQ